MALTQDEIYILAKIRSDVNLFPDQQDIAQRLCEKDLIGGMNVEGSGAAVEHLFLTDLGKLALTWYGPTSDDDAVVDWYALRMKQKLLKRSTDVTKGPLNWRNPDTSIHALFECFMMEVGELAEALFHGKSPEEVIGETVEVGTMAMMIGDKAKLWADKDTE